MIRCRLLRPFHGEGLQLRKSRCLRDQYRQLIEVGDLRATLLHQAWQLRLRALRLAVALEVGLSVLFRGLTWVERDRCAIDVKGDLTGLDLPEIGVDQLAGGLELLRLSCARR